MEKSNEKKPWYKKVLIAIGSVFAGLIALLVGGCLRNNRDRAQDVRDQLGAAEDANNSARGTANNIRQTADSIKQTNNECADVIRNIRKRGPKK